VAAALGRKVEKEKSHHQHEPRKIPLEIYLALDDNANGDQTVDRHLPIKIPFTAPFSPSSFLTYLDWYNFSRTKRGITSKHILFPLFT